MGRTEPPKRKAEGPVARPTRGGKAPKDHCLGPSTAQAGKALEEKKAAEAAEPAAAPVAKKSSRAGKDEVEVAEETTRKPLERLYPSTVRQQPDEAGMVANPRSNGLVYLDKTPMSKLEEMYILSAKNANVIKLVKTMEHGEMTKYIHLPSMAVGQASALLDQKKKGIAWTYQRKPLVRGVHPNSDFETNIKNNGFSATKSILVVPFLSSEEEKSYLSDPTAFRESMLEDAFYIQRNYWIVDGATRFTLCTRSGFLCIFFPLSMKRVQVQVRTSIHGARSLCSRMCHTPVCDVPERGNLYQFDYSLNVRAHTHRLRVPRMKQHSSAK